ncbi:hypothetical protein ABK040_000051 [Willaertia magna]
MIELIYEMLLFLDTRERKIVRQVSKIFNRVYFMLPINRVVFINQEQWEKYSRYYKQFKNMKSFNLSKLKDYNQLENILNTFMVNPIVKYNCNFLKLNDITINGEEHSNFFCPIKTNNNNNLQNTLLQKATDIHINKLTLNCWPDIFNNKQFQFHIKQLSCLVPLDFTEAFYQFIERGNGRTIKELTLKLIENNNNQSPPLLNKEEDKNGKLKIFNLFNSDKDSLLKELRVLTLQFHLIKNDNNNQLNSLQLFNMNETLKVLNLSNYLPSNHIATIIKSNTLEEVNIDFNLYKENFKIEIIGKNIKSVALNGVERETIQNRGDFYTIHSDKLKTLRLGSLLQERVYSLRVNDMSGVYDRFNNRSDDNSDCFVNNLTLQCPRLYIFEIKNIKHLYLKAANRNLEMEYKRIEYLTIAPTLLVKLKKNLDFTRKITVLNGKAIDWELLIKKLGVITVKSNLEKLVVNKQSTGISCALNTLLRIKKLVIDGGNPELIDVQANEMFMGREMRCKELNYLNQLEDIQINGMKVLDNNALFSLLNNNRESLRRISLVGLRGITREAFLIEKEDEEGKVVHEEMGFPKLVECQMLNNTFLDLQLVK